jgi:hypothetical protein
MRRVVFQMGILIDGYVSGGPDGTALSNYRRPR